MLSGKIAVAVSPQKRSLRPGKHTAFYLRYALTVQKTLRSPLFQKFIGWMLKKENIAEQSVKKVQVMVYPFRKQNGNGLAGRWNGKGGVLIYPRRLEYCQRLMQKQTEETVHAYIRNRARASLMHELLHIKYLDDEKKVRKLTKQYFHTFIQHLNISNSDISNMMKLLFKR